MNTTKEQTLAALNIITSVADCIREITISNENGLGGVPSGHLYTRLMEHMNLETYNRIIGMLKQAKVVEERSHLLVWIGPRS